MSEFYVGVKLEPYNMFDPTKIMSVDGLFSPGKMWASAALVYEIICRDIEINLIASIFTLPL